MASFEMMAGHILLFPKFFWETKCVKLILSLVFLLISNPTNKLCLHQFLGNKTNETNKSLKTDANRSLLVGLLMSRKNRLYIEYIFACNQVKKDEFDFIATLAPLFLCFVGNDLKNDGVD